MQLPLFVKIVEVGPRDGLQSESTPIDTDTKVEFINKLSDTGLSVIEATSMVKAGRIPQLSDAEEVYQKINKLANVTYPALVPNLQGMERALAVGVDEIALFASASEHFSQDNINCSTAESLQRFEPVIELAQEYAIPIRAYLSCAFGHPSDNTITADKVADLAELLTTMGCIEISLADTYGICTPLQTQRILTSVSERISIDQLAVHFHDTRGQALANILASLETGVSVIDASVAGLGGCPYAKSASGNVATEDVVYMLNGMNIETGIDLNALIDAGNFICNKLGRDNQSKVGRLGVKP